MLQTVNIRARGWRCTYFEGGFYSANHVAYLPAGSYEYETMEQMSLFDVGDTCDGLDDDLLYGPVLGDD